MLSVLLCQWLFHCLWILGLYFDRSVGLYFDGVGVLVLVSMQNQVVWGLITESLCRLLWWVWSLICLNIGCWFEVKDKKDGFIIIFFFWVFDCVVLQSKTGFLFLIRQDWVYSAYSTVEERRKPRMNANSPNHSQHLHIFSLSSTCFPKPNPTHKNSHCSR